jgi:hypothetical protein
MYILSLFFMGNILHKVGCTSIVPHLAYFVCSSEMYALHIAVCIVFVYNNFKRIKQFAAVFSHKYIAVVLLLMTAIF